MRARYAVVLVSVAVASFLVGRWHSEPAAASTQARRVLYYRDPMHPAYHSAKPGIAPDCGMRLEPVYENGGYNEQPPQRTTSGIRQLSGIHTVIAERRASTHSLRLPGRVVADETRIYKIAPKVEGWVHEIYPVTTGAFVRKGEPLVSIYGRDYRMAQQSYIYALNAQDQVRKDPDPTKDFADSAEKVNLQVAETRTNLENLWFDPLQIREIARTRQAQFDSRITAPADSFVLSRNVFLNQKFESGAELYRLADLTHVWIVADLFAGDQRFVTRESTVTVTVPGSLQPPLPARTSPVLPQFDAASRTLKLRLEMDNPRFVLRPDMLVDVTVTIPLPPAIVLPADSVIDTGLRTIAYVENESGGFEPRDVEAGWRFGDQIEIVKGIRPGERVVAAATFLVDSETKLAGALTRIDHD